MLAFLVLLLFLVLFVAFVKFLFFLQLKALGIKFNRNRGYIYRKLITISFNCFILTGLERSSVLVSTSLFLIALNGSSINFLAVSTCPVPESPNVLRIFVGMPSIWQLYYYVISNQFNYLYYTIFWVHPWGTVNNACAGGFFRFDMFLQGFVDGLPK